MPKKIIILTPFFYQIGGAETFAKELERVVRRRFYVHTCTIAWKHIWKDINWRDSAKVVIRLLPKAFKDCCEIRPDTIHALGFTAAFIAALLKPIFRFRLVVTPLSLYDFGNKCLAKIVKWTLKRADAILAESQLSKENLMQVADINKIKVFTHWIDMRMFHPTQRNNSMLRVLFAGRPIPEKGYDVIKQVEQKLKNVRFTYAQNIPNEYMPRYYQMADVLVVPSLYDESPNRVVAEAAACGCVVITSDKGALPEQIKDFGFSVESTPEAFSNKIDEIDKDRSWLSVLRQGTIDYSKEHLTEKNAEIILKEYQ